MIGAGTWDEIPLTATRLKEGFETILNHLVTENIVMWTNPQLSVSIRDPDMADDEENHCEICGELSTNP